VKPPVLVTEPPGTVTCTSRAPAVPAGVTHVSVVPFTTARAVASVPPIRTALAPSRFVPVIVIDVPPVSGPVSGLTDAIVGATYTCVKAFDRVAVPPGVVTDTLLAPAVPAGVTHVSVVASTTVRPVALTEPTRTSVAPDRFVPVTVIVVPPASEPELGDTDATVGSAW